MLPEIGIIHVIKRDLNYRVVGKSEKEKGNVINILHGFVCLLIVLELLKTARGTTDINSNIC